MIERWAALQASWIAMSRSQKFLTIWIGLAGLIALVVASSPAKSADGAEAPSGVGVFIVCWLFLVFLGGGAFLVVAFLRAILRGMGGAVAQGAAGARSDHASEIAELRREVEQLRRERAASPPSRRFSYARAADGAARSRADRDPRWREGDDGQEASFTYIDVDGEVTGRTIRNWHSAGAYIHGYCLSRRQSRTFRKDRIEDWDA